MTTFIVFISFLGFFLCYNTSKKAMLGSDFFLEKIAQEHPRPSKITGLLLMVIALVGSIVYLGVGAGIFAFFVILMTVGSTIVLLTPLRYIRYKAIPFVFLFAITLELMLI